MPSSASASATPTSETCIGVFELRDPVLVGTIASRGLGVRRAISLHDLRLASEHSLRWKGMWRFDLGAGVELYDARARMWSPKLGTFLSVDEFQFHGGRTTLLEVYVCMMHVLVPAPERAPKSYIHGLFRADRRQKHGRFELIAQRRSKREVRVGKARRRRPTSSVRAGSRIDRTHRPASSTSRRIPPRLRGRLPMRATRASAPA